MQPQIGAWICGEIQKECNYLKYCLNQKYCTACLNYKTHVLPSSPFSEKKRVYSFSESLDTSRTTTSYTRWLFEKLK